MTEESKRVGKHREYTDKDVDRVLSYMSEVYEDHIRQNHPEALRLVHTHPWLEYPMNNCSGRDLYWCLLIQWLLSVYGEYSSSPTRWIQHCNAYSKQLWVMTDGRIPYTCARTDKAGDRVMKRWSSKMSKTRAEQEALSQGKVVTDADRKDRREVRGSAIEMINAVTSNPMAAAAAGVVVSRQSSKALAKLSKKSGQDGSKKGKEDA